MQWSIGQFSTNWTSGFSKFWVFCYKLYAQANFVIPNLNWTCYHCIRAYIMTFICSCIIKIVISSFFVLTYSLPLFFFFFFFGFCSFSCVFVLALTPYLRRLDTIGHPPLLLLLPLWALCFRMRKAESFMRH